MDKKIIRLLINIGKEIRECYKEISVIELDDDKDKFKRYTEVYSKIRDYRALEEHLFSKLDDYCTNEKIYNELYSYIMDMYQLGSETILLEYADKLDFSIEVRRVLNEIALRFSFENNEDDSLDDNDVYKDFFNENVIRIAPLMDDEDIIRFIDKINKELASFDSSVDLSKEQLCQFKYDMFFLDRNLEGMLVEDYCIPSFALVDAKSRAISLFGLCDEEVDRTYDELRESDLLVVMAQLSEAKNEDHFSVQNQIRYLLLDIYFESIDDYKFIEVMNNFEDYVNSSYNDEIFERRERVLNIIKERYAKRISNSMVYEEELFETDYEKELERVKRFIKQKKKLPKKLS